MIGTLNDVHARREGLVLEQWNPVIPTTFILQCYKTNDHSKYKHVNNIILVWYNNSPIPINAIVTLYYINKIIIQCALL